MSRRSNVLIYYLLFALVLLVLFAAGLYFGSVKIPLSGVWDVLTGGNPENEIWSNIILDIRLPRTLAAVLIGMALSVAGLLMQTLFRNSLAGPYILGVSSGASLGVAILLLSGIWLGTVWVSNPWANVLAATMGSVLLLVFVLFFAKRFSHNVSLLIAGIMLGSITGAVVSILQYFSHPDSLKSFVLWTFGDMGAVRLSHLKVLVPLIVISLAGSIGMIKALDASLLGEEAALNAGFRPERIRLYIMILTTLLAGTATAFTGPVAFIGLAVPHITKRLLGSPSHAVLLPGVMLIGGILLSACDLMARLPGYAWSLPLNAVTALVGAPVVISILLSQTGR